MLFRSVSQSRYGFLNVILLRFSSSIVNLLPTTFTDVTAVIPFGPSIHSVFIQLLNRSLAYVLTGSPSWLNCVEYCRTTGGPVLIR